MKILIRHKDWQNGKRGLKALFAVAAGCLLYGQLTHTPEPGQNTADATTSQQTQAAHRTGNTHKAPRPVSIDSALKKATAESPVPYKLMKQVAKVESSFHPDAVNDKSGACGAWQIDPDGTMLELIKKYGAEHGYAALADHIHVSAHKHKHGRVSYDWEVSGSDSIVRAVNNACFDTQLSAYMATEYMEENGRNLRGLIRHRPANFTDAYIEHFLGPGDAKRFLRAHENPKARKYRATDYVSHAAAIQNRDIFFRHNGKPRSVTDVYNILSKKMTNERLPAVMLADNNAAPQTFSPR